MSRAIPNRRVKVYDAEDVAVGYRKTFQDKEPTEEHHFRWSWPTKLRHVGSSLAVAYSSDKWKPRGDYELYKHLAESENQAFAVPGYLRDWHDAKKQWPIGGPMVSFAQCPMPKQFAILGYFVEANLDLFDRDGNPQPGDDGVVKVATGRAYLGASKIMWSRHGGDDEPFLFVYTEKAGPLLLIVGKELDVEADGIVG